MSDLREAMISARDELMKNWESDVQTARIAQLERLLTDACDRMDRARSILTNDRPSVYCNWGVLDTSSLRAAAKEGPTEQRQSDVQTARIAQLEHDRAALWSACNRAEQELCRRLLNHSPWGAALVEHLRDVLGQTRAKDGGAQ